MPPELPEPRSRPLEQIRFYVDEDILGVGYALMWLRPDAVTCGIDPGAEKLPRGILDIDWIPKVAAHGWVAITKNHKIWTNPVEAHAAVKSQARIVGLAGRVGNAIKLVQYDRHVCVAAATADGCLLAGHGAAPPLLCRVWIRNRK